MNHFELLGLTAQFDIDTSSLADSFRDLQRRFHPDKFASSSERDKLMAVQKAAEINDAYQTLKSPITRAEYLLGLQGIELRDEQQTMSDPEFLMQQMELREEIEEIAHSPAPEDRLFEFESKTKKLYQAQLDTLRELLAQQQWPEAANAVRKLKFINKLNYEIERLEDKLLG